LIVHSIVEFSESRAPLQGGLHDILPARCVRSSVLTRRPCARILQRSMKPSTLVRIREPAC